MRKIKISDLLLALFLSANISIAEENFDVIVSDNQADAESFASASGFYARSRHYVMKAIQEFDAGVAYVDPSVLIDIPQWRSTLLDRAEDLERILSPQPKADSQGVTFDPAPRFINKEYLDVKELKKIGTPIKEAKRQTLKVGTKHFAATRNLLIKAVHEFDSGLRLANPQLLVDVNGWRNSILDRAEDLNRILAPKARESETGITYSPDSRLLNGNIR